MTQQDGSGDSSQPDATGSPPLEYQSPQTTDAPAPQGAPWFGYIGLGIALVSLLIGIAGVVFAVFWFIGWTRS